MVSIQDNKIANMEVAGRLVALVHQAFATEVKAGVSLNELDLLANKIITDNGGEAAFLGYQNFPKTICTAVNDQVVHGIPNDYVLKDGDIVSLDVGSIYNGYYGDGAWTYAVGPISHKNKKLMDVTLASLEKALSVVKDGVQVGDIGHAICSYVYENEMSIPEEFTGHGIGESLHEEPHIYNMGEPGVGQTLKAGDTIAIEPIVIYGKEKIKIGKDKWTAITKDGSNAAHYEHTIVITKRGYRILTSLNQKEIING